MSKRKTVETFSVTLIGKDGSHTPVGVDGAPTFHAFHDWTAACAATLEAVSHFARVHAKDGTHIPLLARTAVGDFELIEAITVTTTQVSSAGKLLILRVEKLTGNQVREMRAGALPLSKQITDRRVNA